jgi:hypothetical protein
VSWKKWEKWGVFPKKWNAYYYFEKKTEEKEKKKRLSNMRPSDYTKTN